MSISAFKLLRTAFAFVFVSAFVMNGGRSMAGPEIQLTSPAFKHEGKIPENYTCDGRNFSPPLSWSGIPEKAKSIALITEDPDASKKTWVHWVLYNLAPDTQELPEGLARSDTLPSGAKQGITDFESTGYGGPCPPKGEHRYFFTLYALDVVLDLKPGARKGELVEAMKEHILAEGQLMGTYKRSKFG